MAANKSLTYSKNYIVQLKTQNKTSAYLQHIIPYKNADDENYIDKNNWEASILQYHC